MLTRMLRILVALSGTRWWTLTELAAEAHAPVWSARRDLQVFREAGIPLECTTESRKGVASRYRLAKGWIQNFL